METIKHDFKCQNCGKPATINEQGQEIYSIDYDGNTELIDTIDIIDFGTNNFYCEDCWEKETN